MQGHSLQIKYINRKSSSYRPCFVGIIMKPSICWGKSMSRLYDHAYGSWLSCRCFGLVLTLRECEVCCSTPSTICPWDRAPYITSASGEKCIGEMCLWEWPSWGPSKERVMCYNMAMAMAIAMNLVMIMMMMHFLSWTHHHPICAISDICYTIPGLHHLPHSFRIQISSDLQMVISLVSFCWVWVQSLILVRYMDVYGFIRRNTI